MLRPFAAAAALAACSLLAAPATARAQLQQTLPLPPPPPPPPVEPPPTPPPPSGPSGGAPPSGMHPPQALPPGRMPHIRFYTGAAAANQEAAGSGDAVLLGIHMYSDVLPILQSYWGTELLGVRVGTQVLPLIDGDLGLRVTPFPDWLLRPYARANVGLSLLLVLPVPSAGAAVGLMMPLFNTIFFEVAVGIRRVFNYFDFQQSVDLVVLELSVGF